MSLSIIWSGLGSRAQKATWMYSPSVCARFWEKFTRATITYSRIWLCRASIRYMGVDLCDILEKPAFFANECELFYADTVRHIPQYLLINGFVVKVCIKETQPQAKRGATTANAAMAVSPENSERLSQYLLRLASALKLAVIAHKDDRITRCSSPLKALDRVDAARELLKTWASLMSDELSSPVLAVCCR